MAGNAGGGGSAVLAVRLVTTSTLQVFVFADEREVCRFMPKVCLVEWNDVGVAAFMFGVAERTFPAFGVSIPAMKPALRGDIRTNVLVATPAQFSLLAARKLDVAGGTFFLNIGVAGNHFAGHDQRFQLGMRVLECH